MEEKDLATLIETGLAGLGERFADLNERFVDLGKRMDGRFAQMDGRFAQMDGRFVQMDGRFARLDDEVHQAHIQIEGLRGTIQQLSDGIGTVNDKLDRHVAENDRQFDEIRLLLDVSNVTLRGRVTSIEQRQDELEPRVTALENERR